MTRHNESMQQSPSIIPVEPPIVSKLYERDNITDKTSCEVSISRHGLLVQICKIPTRRF